MTAPENFGYRGVEGKVKKVSIEIPATLKPTEVLIKITHSSLCGTDLHYVPYGIALGHEGVGLVEKIGSGVTTVKVGDRVGAGYLRNVCFALNVRETVVARLMFEM
jgi:D-arabinose 1-dehydrogenase-like Zn-dependent alcohol dehydrogenase